MLTDDQRRVLATVDGLHVHLVYPSCPEIVRDMNEDGFKFTDVHVAAVCWDLVNLGMLQWVADIGYFEITDLGFAELGLGYPSTQVKE